MKISPLFWKTAVLTGLLMAAWPAPTLLAQEDAPEEPKAQKLLELFQAIVEPFAPPVVVQAREVIAPIMGDDVAGGNDQWKALEQQFTGQFRPIFDGQLHFLKTTCKPTDEQFKVIKKEGEEGLKKAVKKVVDLQKKMQMGGFQVGDELSIDPAGDIAATLLEVAKKNLPKEAAAKYVEQMDRSAAYRRRVVASSLVSRMDRDLLLSKKQREQIQEALLANWKDEWGRNIIYQIQDDYQQYPNLPENKLLPLLNDRQTAIWKNIPKQQGIMWGWGGFMGGMVGVGMAADVEGAVIIAEQGVALPVEIDVIEQEALSAEGAAKPEPVEKPDTTTKPEAAQKPEPTNKPEAKP